MMKRPPTVEALHLLLVEASETERRLPRAHPKPSVTYWPVYQAEWLAYADEKTRQNLDPATAQQITRYDQLLDTICCLQEEEDRKILWVTARLSAFRTRIPWLKIGKVFSIDRRTAKRRYETALLSLFYSM
jgi:hypothetical protein